MKIKQLFLSIFIGLLLVTGVSFGAGNNPAIFWRTTGGNLFPSISTWELGSSASRIAKIWATAIDVTNITIGGVSSGNIDMNNNSILNVNQLGSTDSRVVKGWFTDLTVTNTITGSISGNAATVSQGAGSANTNYNIPFNAGGTTASMLVKNGFTYNPSTDVFSSPYISVSSPADASGITITNAIQTPVLTLNTSNANAGARNWSVGTNRVTFGDLIFRAGASQGAAPSVNIMTLLSSGNIGIGTTAPSTKLHLYDNAPTQSYILRLQVSDNTYQPAINFIKERASSADVQTGDVIGKFEWTPKFNSGTNLEVATFGAYYVGSGTTRLGDIYFSTSNTGSAVERMRIRYDGNIGINTSSPSSSNGGLDISSGGLSLVIGADSSNTIRTNATAKRSRIAGYHYTNAEEPIGGMQIEANLASNDIYIGGGSGIMNAATALYFYTAATTTTTTGTRRLAIDSAGNIQLSTNNVWLRQTDNAGTGYINMLKVNASDEIEVGANLSISGYLEGPTDGGTITTFDMPVVSAADNVEQSATFKIDGGNFLKLYSLATGSGTVDNKKVVSVVDFDAQAGIYQNTTDVAAATYDLVASDNILLVSYTATGAVTSLTLPTAQLIDGRTITIKDSGGNAGTNNITVDTEGAEKIDGADTYVINGSYDSITLVSNGTHWFVK